MSVRRKGGSKFNCGSGLNDEDRVNRLDVGMFITVKYFELSKEGVPRFPIFMRIIGETRILIIFNKLDIIIKWSMFYAIFLIMYCLQYF